MAADIEQQPLHILLFPYIATGHLIPVADMAAVFASRGVKCTILTTPANAGVIRSAVDRANAAAALAIDMVTVPFPDVGLPPGVESVTGISSEADMFKLLDGSNRLREPFERFLSERRPDAVVADSFFPWAADAAAVHGVPRLSFLGTSMFARACTHALLRHNPAAADGGDADDVVLPGLPHRVALRRSQLLDPAKPNHRFEWAFYDLVDAADAKSYGEVFNSFADLEPGCVHHYRAALGRRVWLTGPLAHVRTDDIAGAGGLSPDDEWCLRWLDGKPRGSVVYVSFGTLTHFSPAEQRELARGLQISGKNFLWIMGGEDADASEWMPEGFAELFAAGDQRGLIFRGWAPQTRILNHPAVGGFVTHCGWNSVLEAVSAGVPLITWPRYADQFYNEKLIVEVLKVGVSLGSVEYASKLEVRDHVISGETIAEAIGGVMGDDEVAEQRRVKVKELGAKAKRATEKGGSSYEDVGRLIQELMARRSSVVRA